MNFVNLKKVLVLCSALLTFSNISNAADYGIKHKVHYDNNYMYEKNNTDNYTLLQKIESGIVNDIDNSNKKDEILKKICDSETELSLYGSETSSIIKNVISNKKIVQNVTSNDVNNSNILLSSLELINVINNIKTELGINNNEGVGNNAYYDLFKGIATGISGDNMEELKTKIKEECDEDNNQDLFIFTLTEISKYSTYKMNQDNLGTLNEAFSKQNGEFMISKNNKLYYSTNKSEYDNESINNEVSNNLDRLMDLINTNFIMKNSEYNMLSNIASLISTDNFNRIISNTTLLDNNVKSASEFSKIITSIANGEIFRKQQNDNIGGQFDDETKNKMNKITVERIKDLYKKEADAQLSKEEESELDCYRKKYLPSLQQKEKNNNVPLDQREQDILNYEHELEEEQNPIPNKKDNDNVTKYNITGITDKLSDKGLYIESIEVSKDLPQKPQDSNTSYTKVNYNDKTSLDKLISMTKPGLFVIDGLRPHCSTDRVNWSPIVKEIWKSMYSRDAEIKYILDNFRSSDYRTQFLIIRIGSKQN